MRKNQAAQSIALAFGLVGGLGFLGYTMLGDMLESDPGKIEKIVSAPKIPAVVVAAPAAPVTTSVMSVTEPAPRPESPQPISAAGSVRPDVATVQLAANPHTATPYAHPVQQEPVLTKAPLALIAPAAAQTAVLPPPPAPISTQVPATSFSKMSSEASENTQATKRGRRHRRHAKEDAAVEAVVPDVAKAVSARTVEQAPLLKAAPIQPTPVAAPLAQAKPTQTAGGHRPTAAPAATAAFTSKDEMSVIVSGQKAWVQVSPTRTMEAKKGDVLPNLGRILEIRGNQVVAEKGTLTTN